MEVTLGDFLDCFGEASRSKSIMSIASPSSLTLSERKKICQDARANVRMHEVALYALCVGN